MSSVYSERNDESSLDTKICLTEQRINGFARETAAALGIDAYKQPIELQHSRKWLFNLLQITLGDLLGNKIPRTCSRHWKSRY
jgi:hypothetical protein